MLLVIGTQNCINCKMVKTILDKKGIEYEYKLNNEIPENIFNIYLKKAKVLGLMNFPLIIKDEEIITLEDIVK